MDRPASRRAEARGGIDSKRRPVSVVLIVILDGLIGLGLGGIVLRGIANGDFYDHWVSQLFAAVLGGLALAFIASAIGLNSRRPVGWWLALLSHGLLALGILVLFGVACFVLYETWGEENRYYTGGDPLSLAIVSAVFLVLETTVLLPVFLVRKHYFRRVAL